MSNGPYVATRAAIRRDQSWARAPYRSAAAGPGASVIGDNGACSASQKHIRPEVDRRAERAIHRRGPTRSPTPNAFTGSPRHWTSPDHRIASGTPANK
jgi:hypothetical protein